MFRAAGCLAAVALAVVLALFALLAIAVHFRTEAPDVGSVARSQPVAALDHAAVSTISATLKTVASVDTAQVVQGPAAITDYCESDRGHGFMPGWQPTFCRREVAEYLFSNGPIQQTTAAWATALHAAGWFVTEPNTSSDLHGYTTGQGFTIDIHWLKQSRATSQLISNGPAMQGQAVASVQSTNVPRGVAASAPYAHYAFVAVAMLNTTYYDAAEPDPTHTSSSDTQHPCVTGSGACS